ncbi:MAG: uridylate kinase [Parcubacteria group bacterium Gr01-1014_31]|nr:MAG: uridylate kinase [Parcubacteria group bacterium Gr01-1014_31]
MKTIVFSLGGSLITPDGVDAKFLAGFRRVVLRYVRGGNRAIIVCGGGNTAREYVNAVRRLNPKVTSTELDWLGIEATKLNAWLVRDVFGKDAEHQLLYNPTKKIRTGKKIIIGSGWKPGCSSDKDAVLAAMTFSVDTVVNLSNIDYVYDRDPKRFKGAKPLPSLSWPAFKRIVGGVWKPGAHVPFDPVASKLARSRGIRLVIMRGSNLANLRSFLAGKKFSGTLVS